ncbi:IS110 family transposase [Georgenia muralis]|uniref:Transposase IS116/IS110/IS902 family protein n=1 Tax=Georgenia muralis TaxID=154117 RepID=A0A3N5A6G7_9MICO|nr:IS110 family transposase [Georgenia muralis]RPF26108.1 transposase IS116/IS110/IS902 family protein [Georgenia muralis]RPF27311.1 transposase IS116/IS110/IS902 family protein [Georgenia muralis]RPF27400.1 transposase IS116/IS110/IS902 family protein [Georgenia muralis]RPF27786.1 transposase IS116/IS110/IS902 family protein [Georgenia muralis]RPF28007.1 transposase IS116/IS110/IS902 family protein [Georgenia muralis]
MKQRIAPGWAGVDVGKGHHWICLIDEAGTTVWSTKVVNDEAAILDAIAGVLGHADEVVWGVDVTGTMSGLLLALLAAHGQRVRYVPGRTVNQMASAYRGEAKTDARDAYVIAETLRHRGDLQDVEVATALVTELRLLVTHRTDLVGDRVRVVNRLRDVLSGYFPALERSFDYAHSRGALVLLTGYQTPQAIRRTGESRLRAWLVKRKVRSADQIAAAALGAAKAQQTVVPGQDVAASIVADLAAQLLALGARISDLDARITTTFRAHPQAEIIESLPGMGPILGAELVAAAGDLAAYANAGRLASAAGLVPVPRDSGRRTGNLHRPMRYSRKLRRVFYLSASAAMMREGPNRDYYLKKRGQGHGHVQALIALARRRVDVLWALLRDNRPFELAPPSREPMAQTA